MNGYTKILSIFTVAMIILASSCSEKQREITDMQQRKVVLPQKIDKVVCLSPGIAELFYKFSLEEKLIGRSYFCHLPQQINAIPQVGGLYKLDTNMIIELNPDLVLSSDLLPWEARNFLFRHKIALVMFKDNKKFEDIYPAIELFGKIFRQEEKAKELIDKTKQEFDGLNRTDAKNKPTAYFYVQFNGKDEITVNENNLIGSLMTAAGLENIAMNDSDMKFSHQELIDKDPDYVLLFESKYDNFIISSSYSALSAVRNKKVIAVKQEYLNPLSLSNLEFIKQIQEFIK